MVVERAMGGNTPSPLVPPARGQSYAGDGDGDGNGNGHGLQENGGTVGPGTELCRRRRRRRGTGERRDCVRSNAGDGDGDGNGNGDGEQENASERPGKSPLPVRERAG